LSERKKLPRLHSGKPYITGDTQDWTYEYTWEDAEAAGFGEPHFMRGTDIIMVDRESKFPQSDQVGITPDGNPEAVSEIRKYFYKHPEKLLQTGRYKLDSGEVLTVEHIRKARHWTW